MPRAKRVDDSDESNGDEESPIVNKPMSKVKAKREPSPDDEEEEVLPKTKKPRASNATAARTNGEEVEVETNGEGDSYIKLSEFRRATVRTFKGKVLIDLRETYKDKNSGEMKPGSKGISLTAEQWEVLRTNIGTIDKLVNEVSKGKSS